MPSEPAILQISTELQAHVRNCRKPFDPQHALHLAVGIFDGIHLGHRKVLESAIAASQPNGCCGLLTFDPHPSRLLRPEAATRMMMPLEQRIDELLGSGLDIVAVRTFTRAFSLLDQRQFVATLKADLPGIRSLHVGSNFRFAHQRMAGAEDLASTARDFGIKVSIIAREHAGGEAISSSRIRAELEAGRMAEVCRLLGRPYSVKGKVVGGRKLGRTLGFPTLNIPWDPELKPPYGVYAVTLESPDARGVRLHGVANYGIRPTLEQAGQPLLEVHLFGGEEAVPQTTDALKVNLHHWLRPEKRFGNLEALRQQIATDKESAARFFDLQSDLPISSRHADWPS